MSFDIFVQHPAAAKSEDEIPEDFVPKPIGTRRRSVRTYDDIEMLNGVKRKLAPEPQAL